MQFRECGLSINQALVSISFPSKQTSDLDSVIWPVWALVSLALEGIRSLLWGKARRAIWLGSHVPRKPQIWTFQVYSG